MPVYRKDSKQFLEFLEHANEKDLMYMPVYGLTVSEKIKSFERLKSLRPDLENSLQEQIEGFKNLFPDDPKALYREIEPA